MISDSILTTVAVYVLIWALFMAVPPARAVVLAQLSRLSGALRARIWIGLVCGALLVVVNALLMVAGAGSTYAGTGRFLLISFAANLAFVAIVASTEEMILRGVLLTRLRQVSGPWLAVIATAVIFSIMHVGRSDFSVISATQYFLDGLLLGWMVLATGDIWASTGFHFGKNLMVSLLFGSSRHIIDPLFRIQPALQATRLSAAMDLLTYALMIPLCLLLFRAPRTRISQSGGGHLRLGSGRTRFT